MPKPTDKETRQQAEDTARKNLALIRDLKECGGFRLWLLPRLQRVRDQMSLKVSSGKCSDHADYLATVALIESLDVQVFRALDTDEERHLATLSKPAP